MCVPPRPSLAAHSLAAASSCAPGRCPGRRTRTASRGRSVRWSRLLLQPLQSPCLQGPPPRPVSTRLRSARASVLSLPCHPPFKTPVSNRKTELRLRRTAKLRAAPADAIAFSVATLGQALLPYASEIRIQESTAGNSHDKRHRFTHPFTPHNTHQAAFRPVAISCLPLETEQSISHFAVNPRNPLDRQQRRDVQKHITRVNAQPEEGRLELALTAPQDYHE